METLIKAKSFPRNVVSFNQNLLKKQISQIPFNSELIEFFDSQLSKMISPNIRLHYLLIFRKLFRQTARIPDEAHFRCFEVEYNEDKRMHKPLKWLKAEIEYTKGLLDLDRPEKDSPVSESRANELPLLSKSDALRVLDISISTLNRRIAEGMPCHKKGKNKYFDLDEIKSWIKSNDE